MFHVKHLQNNQVRCAEHNYKYCPKLMALPFSHDRMLYFEEYYFL